MTQVYLTSSHNYFSSRKFDSRDNPSEVKAFEFLTPITSKTRAPCHVLVMCHEKKSWIYHCDTSSVMHDNMTGCQITASILVLGNSSQVNENYQESLEIPRNRPTKQICDISYAGSEIMTHMHDNFALPFDAIHVLVIKKLFCAQHTYIQDHELDCATPRYHRSKLVVNTSRIAL